MAGNPFTLSFGIAPKQYIARTSQTEKIVESFLDTEPSDYTYIISGVRGSGKTVMLSTIAEEFDKKKDWIVINVTPDIDIVNAIVGHLYSQRGLRNLFVEAKIDLSALGIGVSIKNATPVYDMTVALESLLKEIDKKKYRVLIAIDEIVNNKNVKVFAGIFQLLIRQKLPIFLVATGLYESINSLQNEKTLTFLYRAPKVYLEALSIVNIALSYKAIFNVSDEKARRMANLTKGYAYAYQVLGYLYAEKYLGTKEEGDLDAIMNEYDGMLSEYVYEKIWSELPNMEKQIVTLLVKNDQMKIQDIREELNISTSQMSVYRDRLKRKGLVETPAFGQLSLCLPRFKEIAYFWIE